MKLSDWASIAEIVASIAVIVTLILLLVGVRENTAITRASAYQSNIDTLNDWRVLSLTEGIGDDWLEFMQSGTISERQSDVMLLNLILFTIYEKTYYSNEYGILGDQEWARFQEQMCIRANQLERWDSAQMLSKTTFTDEFIDYLQDSCDLSL